MRKLFTFFFALMVTTSLWAYDFQSGDLYFNITNDTIAPYTIEVTYQRQKSTKNYAGLTTVTIPETIIYNGTTYSVTSIGYAAFEYCSSLTSVTIGNSVTSIGEYAFGYCSSLTSVTIPNSVTSIGEYAFGYCSSLTSITIPNSVTSIGSHAFYNCSSLTSISIPNSVTSIGDWAFAETPWYNNLSDGVIYIGKVLYEYKGTMPANTSINIKDGIVSISPNAFWDCSSLTSVTIPNSVTSIGGGAFYRCTSLTSVTIPESVTSIEDNVFTSCSSLTSITIPNSVTSIGDYAFGYCSSLTSVTIPNSVTSIGDYAFGYCSSLTSVTIPNSVTSIGEKAFYNTPWYNNQPDGVVYAGKVLYKYKGDMPANTSIVIEEGTVSIAPRAFYECSSLTSITIPNSVTSIGFSAFSGCSSLTSVTIGNNVTSIGDDAFSGCTSLESITIPNSVTSIGGGAFSNCSSFTSIAIPCNVTRVDKTSFSGCTSLSSVVWNAKTSIDYNKFSDTDYYYERISPFHSSKSTLKSIIFGDSVEYIPEYICAYLDSLKYVTIGNSVTSIGQYAFLGCDSITKTNYTGDIASWCNIKFDGYSANPMYYSHNFYINDQEIKDLVIPNSVDSIHDYAFYRCTSLTSITIPNSVTSIGDDAFGYCSSLTSITIPNSVTSIGDAAFYYCFSLTSVTIGESVTSIGEDAFAYCSSLTSITCKAATPPTGGSDAFYWVSKSIPVYVPCGCIEAYKAASGWEDFTNIQELLAEYSIEVNVNDTIMGSAKVDKNTLCDACISATPNLGYHFVQWNDGNTENPRTLELTQDTILTAEFAQSFFGQCGDNLYWSYNETVKTISITGSGEMYDYTATTQPWLLFKEQIVEVTTTNTVTSIGTSAFEGCARLSKVSLGTGLEEIAANAFAGCTRLYDVYCYATNPPFAEQSSFANYNVYLYVPCESQRNYTLDVIWGNFKFIECIESEDVTTDGVLITPSTNDVTITWPTEGNADTYTIVIKKGDTVFCTLTFNADGQLLNIAFAPGRNGNHPAQYAEQAGNGYRFTITGLESGTKYGYNIDVKDASNKTIKSHSGEFTTQSTTAVENTHSQSPTSDCQKIIRNGQLLILRDGVEYTIMGAEIK